MPETLAPDSHVPTHPEQDAASGLAMTRSTYNEVLTWVTDINLELDGRCGPITGISGRVEHDGGREAYISSWLASDKDDIDSMKWHQEQLLADSAAGLGSLHHYSDVPIQQKIQAVGTVWRATEALSDTLVEPQSVNEGMRKLVDFMRVLTQRGEFTVDLIKSTPSMRNAYRLMGAVENTLLGDNDSAIAFLSDMEDSPGLQKIFSSLLVEASKQEYKNTQVTREESKEHLDDYITKGYGIGWPEVKTPEAQHAKIGVAINTDPTTVASVFRPDSHGRYFAFSEFPDYLSVDKSKPSKHTYNSWGADGARDIVEREAGFRGNIFMPYPVYGAVSSDVEPMGAALSYGEFAAIWVKDEVLEREGTNFVIGDSTYSARNVTRDDAEEAYRHTLDKKLVQGSGAVSASDYIEARIPFLRVNDIERVSLRYDSMALAKLNRGGLTMPSLVELITSNGVGVEVVVSTEEDLQKASQIFGDTKGVTIKHDDRKIQEP